MTSIFENMKAMMCLTMAMALWASAFIALKIALEEVPPFLLIFSRLALGSLFFLMLWKYKGQAKIEKKDYVYLLIMGALEPCLYFIFETMALQYTTASQAGVVFAFLPIFIIVFGFFALREKPSISQCLGGVVATLGVILLCLTGTKSEAAIAPVKGNFLELLAMACAAVYTVMLKKLSGQYSPFLLAALQSFIGTVFFLPFAIYESDIPREVSVHVLLAVLYLGTIVTAGAYTFFNIGISKVSASEGGMYFNLIPMFTLLFSVLILNESVDWTQMMSMMLVIFGVSIGLIDHRFFLTRLRRKTLFIRE
ncbi:DMT family transporter [Pseudomonas farris]